MQHDNLAELDRQLTDPVARAPVRLGRGPVRLGGPVVAGPSDDALAAAHLEIMAALNGEPTPGGI
jgi:hypothetical protein